MISKQVGAFLAGMIVVAAGIGAFFIYDQQKGSEYEVEADTNSGDKKVGDDPTSGFKSYDGQQYFLHYGGLTYAAANGYTTAYGIEFTVNKPGVLKAYVDNILMPINTLNYRSALYFEGTNKINLTTAHTDGTHSGVELLKELQFSFQPVTEKQSSLRMSSNLLDTYHCLPTSGTAQVYQNHNLIWTFALMAADSMWVSWNMFMMAWSMILLTMKNSSAAAIHIPASSMTFQSSVILEKQLLRPCYTWIGSRM